MSNEFKSLRNAEVGILKQQRQQRRNDIFKTAMENQEKAVEKSQAKFAGRNENGVAVETRQPSELGIRTDKWVMEIEFWREDRANLPDVTRKELDALIRKSDIPRKKAKTTTHVISGVREFKHIRAGYEREIEMTDSNLAILDKVNVELAMKMGVNTRNDIEKAKAQLEKFDMDTLAVKYNALKEIDSRKLVLEIISLLNEAMDGPENKKALRISNACAKFTALRERIGTWRDREIARHWVRNKERECAARALCEVWLLGRLEAFAQDPKEIYGYVIYDAGKLRALDLIWSLYRKMRTFRISEKTESQMKVIHDEIKKCKSLFTTKGRVNDDKTAELMESGLMNYDSAKKIDFQRYHYIWMERYMKKFDTEQARRKLEHLKLFVRANKPGFILKELEKTDDPYMRPVVAELGIAVSAYKKKDFDTAKVHFRIAASEMRSILEPA
jgi:hypothetical protein